MSRLMRLRRAVARRLPPRVKAILRRVLPKRLVGWAPRVRRFELAMPDPPDFAGVPRPPSHHRRIVVEAPWRSYVPRLLEADGLAGYEPETMAAFLAAITIREGVPVVFDVGANVGVFALVAAATTRADVTGFEPTPQLVETFRDVAAANGLACSVEGIALGAMTGTATLFLSAQSDSSNSLKAGFRPTTGTVEVPVERLDDYVARTGRPPVLMKIDTETTEPDVLAGGLETLRVHQPWIVCEVLAGKTEAGLHEILRPLGYRYHHLTEAERPVELAEIVGDRTYRHRDWLFTPEPLPPRFEGHYAAWRAAIRATTGR